MKTQQPSYWCIENIGDVDPLEHGGGFVIVDRTGVYDPELLILDVNEDDKSPYLLNSIVLEPLIRIKAEDGFHKLSDNKYHPEMPAWFGDAKSLQSIANSSGRRPYYALLDSFLSSCPVERGLAYMDAVRHFGTEEFNSEPRELTHEKAKALCDTMLAQIQQTKTWHIGYGVQ